MPEHPGASSIGSQLWMETAPMAGKSWQPAPAQKGRQAAVTLWKEGGKGGEMIRDVQPYKAMLNVNAITVKGAGMSQSRCTWNLI